MIEALEASQVETAEPNRDISDDVAMCGFTHEEYNIMRKVLERLIPALAVDVPTSLDVLMEMHCKVARHRKGSV